MSGVYDAYASRLGFGNVKLQMEEEMDRELFAEYVEVLPNLDKSKKVLQTIRRELGMEAYESICRAAASWDQRKADAIFRTIVLGLHLPQKTKVMHCLTKDYICLVAELGKKTWNEAHRYMGFIRFQELAGGILYASLCPENDILPLIAPHFADRFPEENWVIMDERRGCAAIHKNGKEWMLLEDCRVIDGAENLHLAEEGVYQAMWKTFVKSIAIEARKNVKLQKQLLPLKFRDKMTEFQS